MEQILYKLRLDLKDIDKYRDKNNKQNNKSLRKKRGHI
jgi:hypothetical protein